jgi:protocatechuate 3,4-dioxygenase beta subunit
MKQPSAAPRTLTRRQLLEGLTAIPAAAVFLAACGGDETTSPSTSPTSDAATGAGSETTAASGQTSAAAGGDGTATSWASGGTDLITVEYPDDSIFELDQACPVDLTGSTTEGPCYFHSDTTEDISTGKSGLPMQLCLRLEDANCNPLEGYTIEAWHCDERGTYSGDTTDSNDAGRFAGDFCTGGDSEAETSTYFRGQRTTDASGRANFKTCFPGWYSGRTVHIHVAVTDPSGASRVISQFGFADELADEIYTQHPLYADRGSQDTTITDDSVFPSQGWENYVLSTSTNSDGSMLAAGIIRIS